MLCLSCGLLFAACGPVDAHNNDAENAIPKPDSIVTITIRAVGDLMCHAPQFEYARLGTDTFDFRRCYAEVAVLEDFREALAVELHVHVFAAFAVNDSRNDSFLPQTIDGSCADGGS